MRRSWGRLPTRSKRENRRKSERKVQTPIIYREDLIKGKREIMEMRSKYSQPKHPKKKKRTPEFCLTKAQDIEHKKGGGVNLHLNNGTVDVALASGEYGKREEPLESLLVVLRNRK